MISTIETDLYIYIVESTNLIKKGRLYYDTAAIDDGEHCIHIAEKDIINPPAQVLIKSINLK